MASEIQPTSMASTVRDLSTPRADPAPEAASAVAPSPALNVAANAQPSAGHVALVVPTPIAEEADLPDAPSHPILSENETPLIDSDTVPPLAMSEIGTDDSYQRDLAGQLPSALFVLPFPAPVNARRAKNTPPFLMYSPPRSVYQRPAKPENARRPKEKVVKKVVRKWQEEVVMGEKIKRGELENPSRFKKVRGGCIRVASTLNKWLPNSCIETLGRLPPKRKLGSVIIIHPSFNQAVEVIEEVDQDRPYQPTPDELLNDIGVLLRKTRKRVLTRAIISGMLLPISAGIDVFAPVFALEINLTYFAFQIYGLKKCDVLTVSPQKKPSKPRKRIRKTRQSISEETTLLADNSSALVARDGAGPSTPEETFQLNPVPQHELDSVMVLLYNICSKIDPVSFPPLVSAEVGTDTPNSPPLSQTSTLPPSLKKPGGAVVKEMIQAFRDTLPPEVTERYLLDEERLSEDLARYLKKASKEYIDSLSGRGDRKGLVHWLKTRKQKSAVKKMEKAEKSRLKKEAKKQREAEQQIELIAS
ncbi:hypothetical protein PGT21_036569 [Puccinia graminis f. sp. tritici]|uniref:Uncharacterized protein n=1 Tax=Puccinia graminis f. sp. tritici TaxID=56615 RepID=A0A5B0R9I7_PUCGR|nr:hypothetical protein PGT21_036569 [Puccinia graminis f. sp. tritici]KAA1121474.1 hypothetical protein PGTUg99_028240 [Puccinia graminis f. sp. tritici]